jgi:hypothetical protein
MIPSDFEWFRVIPSDSRWFWVTLMIPSDSEWFQMILSDSNDSKWFRMIPNNSRWFCLLRTGCFPLGLYTSTSTTRSFVRRYHTPFANKWFNYRTCNPYIWSCIIRNIHFGLVYFSFFLLFWCMWTHIFFGWEGDSKLCYRPIVFLFCISIRLKGKSQSRASCSTTCTACSFFTS